MIDASNPISAFLSYGSAGQKLNALASMAAASKAQAAMDALKQAALPALLQQQQQEGAQAVQQNADKLKYLPLLLGNQLAQGNLRDQAIQQSLKENPQLFNARLALLRAQQQKVGAPDYQSPLGKLAGDYTQYAARYGANSPIAQSLLGQIKALQGTQNGINVMIAPSGGQLVGGIPAGTSSIPGAQLQQNSRTPVTMQNAGGLAASPFAPQSRYSTGGRTLEDLQTGNSASVPTQENVSFAQQGLLGEDAADSVISDLNKSISPELGGVSGVFSRGTGEVSQLLGQTDPLYANYLAATRSEIPGSAEQLVKAYGLHPTNQLTKMVEGQITPQTDDTSYSYNLRLAKTRAMLALRGNQYQSILKSGIPLQKDASGKPTIPALTAMYLNKQNPQFGKIYADSLNNGIPDKFDSKAAFLKWKQSASPQALQIALQKFGGQ